MMIFKLAFIAAVPAATTTFAVVETIPAQASWTPELIGALFLGLTTLMTSLLNVYFTHKSKKAVQADVKEVHTVVQGGTLTLLKQLSSLKDERAEDSGRASDQRSAEVARTAVTDKETSVANAAAAKSAEVAK